MTDTTTQTLAEFLLARLAEDEVVARAASPGGWQYGDVESVAGGTLYDESRSIADLTYEQLTDHDGSIVRHLLSNEADANGEHIARHDPTRVLAQVEAHRRIVELHSADTFPSSRSGLHLCEDSMITPDECPTLRALASVYADHPDYREEWAL